MTPIIVRARDSAQAMDEVLRRLGENAYILSTTHKDGMVEIRAAAETAALRSEAQDFAALLRRGVERSAEGKTPRPAPDASVVAQDLAEALAPADTLADLLSSPPGRILIAGPPGSGKSMLAARLAAAFMRASADCLPRLVVPRHGPVLCEDRLRGWARLMDLPVERPLLRDLLLARAWRPAGSDAPQIVDLSDLPEIGPETVAELAATPGTLILIALPAGLSARQISAVTAPWQPLSARVVLTRTDHCEPSQEELALLHQLGLPLAFTAGGTGLLDTLAATSAAGIARWAAGWAAETSPMRLPQEA